jgi:adhesin transport system outer membrane protein
MVRIIVSFLAVALTGVGYAFAQEAFTLRDAIMQAVQTNPGIGEAAANRRATESELRQNQSTLLPQVRLEASAGPERLNQKDIHPPLAAVPLGNDETLYGRKGSVVVRQLLFDGFQSINEIWRQSARVQAAAARVHERSELIALDTTEAYIDIARYTRLVALADENVAAHRNILGNVEQRFRGGRAGEGDLQQTVERVEAALAAQAEFRRSLDDARSKYRKVVGLEPYNLRAPGRLAGLPHSKDEALAITLTRNPTIKAAQGDTDAAKYAFRSTAGAFMPNVSLEGRLTEGKNTDGNFGSFDSSSGKVVMSWDVFTGGRDSWRRVEAAERYTEQTMRHARLQRDANESVDRAWAARTITQDRITALTRQIAADRKVITAYSKEYELGQRSLIDLLNAQNQLFNGQVSLISARAVVVFSDYQLLAAMGSLLDYLKQPHPVDAEPLAAAPYGLIAYKFAPVLIGLPSPGPEPLNPALVPPTGATTAAAYAPENPPAVIRFSDRWSNEQTVASTDWLNRSHGSLGGQNTASSSELAYGTADGWYASAQAPIWPLKK